MDYKHPPYVFRSRWDLYLICLERSYYSTLTGSNSQHLCINNQLVFPNMQIYRRRAWLICIVGSIICMSLMYYKSKADLPDYADARQYLAGGYNLASSLTYTQIFSDGVAQPGIGREPAFPALTALLIRIDPNGMGQLTPDCLASNWGCSPVLYQSAQWVNRLLFTLAGGCLFFAGLRVFSNLKAATVSGGSVWLNIQMQKNMDYVVSDPLALFFACAFALTIVVFHQSSRKFAPALMAGVILGALILTKAIYLYFLYLIIVTYAFLLIIPGTRRRLGTSKIPMVFFLICAALGPALWMSRNANITGEFSLTDSRGGVALSTREVFNHMTSTQYAASMVYWTRGFGDSLAKKIFAEATWRPFDIAEKGGFYDRGQNGYGKRVQTAMAVNGLSRADAQTSVDKQLRQAILEKPFIHLLTTIPLFWRGIWVDLFAWISIPGLFVLIVQSVRKRDSLMLMILTPALFNLIFYALFSLNIPRYQITAAPAFAMALGSLSIWVGSWWKKRKPY
jgi:hypothetical protein